MSSTQLDAKGRIGYVLFDMDGLMINSEDVYTEVTNKILGRYGHEMSWEIKSGCMGRPERPATEHLLSCFPGIPISIDEYIVERRALQDLSWPHVKPMPGILRLVHHLIKHKIPIAVATGSQRRNYDLKTAHLQESLFGLFGKNVVCGDDAELIGKGKPMPDVFLVAAKKLGMDVGEGDVEKEGLDEKLKEERTKGLVFEDAISGVQAGKRAGMKVIWIPDPRLKAQFAHEGDYGADEVLTTLEEFRPEEWGLPPYDDVTE
ncbi:hypothetical protein FRB95_002968 [Tulasnella sp. JGI-2019a]|nr:hypothetical protein FRB95_002968 [Tulasnella sp. JGI-2019a]